MSNNGQVKPDGLYWVLISFQTNPGKYEWALGHIRTGHFTWVFEANGFHVQPISLRDLLKAGNLMVPASKPSLPKAPVTFQVLVEPLTFGALGQRSLELDSV